MGNHQVHHQTLQEEVIMIKDEFWKVALSSSLLFFMLYTGMIFNLFESSLYQWTYKDYNYVKDIFEPNTLTPWVEDIRWFVQRITNRTNIFIFAIVFLINPDFNRWGLSIKIMWVSYFAINIYSFQSSYDSIPYRINISILLTCVQVLYTAHCYYLYHTNKGH
jgi:hypothetical protein